MGTCFVLQGLDTRAWICPTLKSPLVGIITKPSSLEWGDCDARPGSWRAMWRSLGSRTWHLYLYASALPQPDSLEFLVPLSPLILETSTYIHHSYRRAVGLNGKRARQSLNKSSPKQNYACDSIHVAPRLRDL